MAVSFTEATPPMTVTLLTLMAPVVRVTARVVCVEVVEGV
jgi:hypothetical protein